MNHDDTVKTIHNVAVTTLHMGCGSCAVLSVLHSGAQQPPKRQSGPLSEAKIEGRPNQKNTKTFNTY